MVGECFPFSPLPCSLPLQVSVLIGFVVMSQSSEAAQGVVAHMLLHPDNYRYPTVMEHVLHTLILVQHPTQQVLHALLTLVRGLERMEQDELAIIRAAVNLNTSKAEDFALNVSAVLIHQNALKSSAVMTLAGLINRGRMVAGQGSILVEEVVSAKLTIVYPSFVSDLKSSARRPLVGGRKLRCNSCSEG